MAKVGTAPCRVCAREIVVKENERGTQNWSCPHCDASMYVKKGTEAHAKLQAVVKRDAPAAGAPGSDTAPPKAPEKKTGFRMPGT